MAVSQSKAEGSLRCDRACGDLANWRSMLLGVFMQAGGLGMVLVASVLGLTHAYPSGPRRLQLVIAGIALIAGSALAHRVPRILSVALCVVACGILVQWIPVVGWSPIFVVANIFVIVMAGLLLGRGACYAVVATTSAAFVVSGLLLRHGAPRPDFPAELDPSSQANWMRIALTYGCLTVVTAWALGKIGALLARAEAELARSVTLLEERLALLDATKARRSSTGEALRDAQRLHTIAQLGRGFAQLFSNVLTTISTAIEEARLTKSLDVFSVATAMIRDAVAAAAHRGRDLLSVSRPQRSSASECDLERLLLELSSTLQARLRGNIALELDLQAAGWVTVTGPWLDQVLTNLLLNAEQAMPDGGNVVIRTRLLSLDASHPGSCRVLQPGWYASIRVSDDGPGMNEEVIERAFEPFYTTRDTEKHDGLGLTVVYEMVSQAGGSIELERPDSGASVAIYLPCRVASTGDASPNAPPDPDPTPRAAPPAWKPAVLGVLCRIGAWCTLVSVVVAEFHRVVTGGAGETHLIIGIPLAAVFVLTGWYWKWSFESRLACVVGSALVTGYLFLAIVGFMAPAPIAIATLAILLLWLLHSPFAALLALAATMAAFAGIGHLYSVGMLVGYTPTTSLARPENWSRVAVTVSCVDFLAATVLLYIVRAARQRVEALRCVQVDLERAKQETEAEARALSHLQALAARSSRIESLGRVTGMIAHDLNNSLQSLGGWTEILAGEAADPADRATQDILLEMAEAARYAEALVSSLAFDDSRCASDTALDVSGAALRAKGLLEALLGQRQTLAVETHGELWAHFDEPSLRRVLMNLVANARDAMPPDGHCRVRVKKRAEWVELTVDDDGCGMSESTKIRIFDAFFTTKGSEGTGLGLHSVAATLHTFGGQIEVWSEPGKGARFVCRLQRATTPTETHIRPRLTQRSVLTGRVLLADGDALVRRALRLSLTRIGFEVTEVATGTEALRILAEARHFEALCADAILAGRTSQDVVRAFVSRFPGRPAVVMSGYGTESIAAMLDLRGVRLLRKPFAGSELIEILKGSLAAECGGAAGAVDSRETAFELA